MKRHLLIFCVLTLSFLPLGLSQPAIDSIQMRFSQLLYDDFTKAKSMTDSLCNKALLTSDPTTLVLCKLFSSKLEKGDKQLKKLFEVLEYVEKNPKISKIFLLSAYNSIAYFYYSEIHDLEKSIYYGLEGIKIAENTGEKSGLAYRGLLWGLSESYLEKKDTISALFYLKRELDAYKNKPRDALVDFYFLQSEWDSVIKFGLEFLESTSARFNRGPVLYKMGLSYLNKRDTLSAKRALVKAFRNAVSKEITIGQFEISSVLSRIYESQLMYDSSLFYKNIQNITQDSIKNIATIRRIIKAETSQTAKEAFSNSKGTKTWALLAFIVLVSSFIGLYLYTKKRKELVTTNPKKDKDTIHFSDETMANLDLRMIPFFQEKRYLQKNITIDKLAFELNFKNVVELRDYITQKYLQNYTEFINELRINEVVSRLKEDKFFRNYTMDHIASEVGFSSRSVFSTVFKRIKGIPPADFIKSIKNE